MEQVWGVPRQQLFAEISPFHGFRDAAGQTLADIATRLEPLGEFRPRQSVEEDPEFQQVIPYVVVRHLGPDDSGAGAVGAGAVGEILLLERLATQGERRLHHHLSIGVGGHVNPEAPGPEPLLVRGLRREVCEELELEPTEIPAPELLGFVNDDSNAVGAVHFGVVCRIDVGRRVEVRERDRMSSSWIAPRLLATLEERLESWSRFVARAWR